MRQFSTPHPDLHSVPDFVRHSSPTDARKERRLSTLSRLDSSPASISTNSAFEQGERILPSEARRLIQKWDALKGLSTEAQEALPALVRLFDAPRGSVLYRAGDDSERCYVVVSGEVALWESEGSTGKKAANRTRSSSTCSTAASSTNGSPCRDLWTPEMFDRQGSNQSIVSASSLSDHLLVDADALGTKVASVGVGRMFGDFDMLPMQQHALRLCQPQALGATCTKDCQLLVIDRHDFNRVLRPELYKSTKDTLELLRKSVPGLRSCGSIPSEALLHCFPRMNCPNGRAVFTQGAPAKVGLYVVASGSVFTSCVDEDVSKPTDDAGILGSLTRGSIFGSLAERGMLRYSAISTLPCELFHCSSRNFKRLPSSVQLRIDDHLEGSVGDASGQPSEPCAPRANGLQQRVSYGSQSRPRLSVPDAVRTGMVSPGGLRKRSDAVPLLNRRMGSTSPSQPTMIRRVASLPSLSRTSAREETKRRLSNTF